MFLETGCNDLISVRKGLDHLLHLAVILEVLDCKISCRILVADFRVLLQQQFDTVYALFEFRPVVDMYMTGQTCVCVLIYLYDRVEKIVYSLSVAADGRYDRHSEEISQLLDVQVASLGLQFVVHIHRHHHAQVHVDELRCQIEVSLQI